MMEITPIRIEAQRLVIPPPGATKVVPIQDDTSYLLAIPGMRESILEGLNTPVDECDDKIEW
jgi:hypothetical protein